MLPTLFAVIESPGLRSNSRHMAETFSPHGLRLKKVNETNTAEVCILFIFYYSVEEYVSINDEYKSLLDKLLTWVWVGFRSRVLPGQECLASPPPCSSASETRATGPLQH